MTDTPSPLTRCALDAVGPNPQGHATAIRLLRALATYKPARWDDAGDLDAWRLNQDARAELMQVAAELEGDTTTTTDNP